MLGIRIASAISVTATFVLAAGCMPEAPIGGPRVQDGGTIPGPSTPTDGGVYTPPQDGGVYMPPGDSGVGQPSDRPLAAVSEAEVLGVLQAQLAGAPGGVVAVSHGSQILVMGAAGVTEAGGSTPVTVDHQFQAGSVGKMFTAALIMKLVEEGVLNLTDPISRWTSQIQIAAPYDISSQTLELLLSHRAGHPYGADESVLFGGECGTGIAGFQSMVQRLNPQPLEYAPGTRWSYSNHGVNLAGFVAQEATGIAFADLIRQRIFMPAGMPSAGYDEAAAPTRVAGHSGGSSLGTNAEPACAYFDPAGTVLPLKISDMIHFAMMLMNDGQGVISAQSVAQMMTPLGMTDYEGQAGLGCFIRDVQGERSVGHSGSTYGFSAHIETLPDRRLAAAVMINSDSADPTQIATDVLKLYLR